MKSLLILVAVVVRNNPGPAAVGVRLIDQETKAIVGDLDRRLPEPLTNNQAEYAAIIFALEEAKKIGAKIVEIKTSSQVAAKQINNQWRSRTDEMERLAAQVRHLGEGFDRFRVTWVYGPEVLPAKELAKKAMSVK